MPSKILLSGCPNQSAKVATSSNVGFAVRAVPGACQPGGMPPPAGVPPPVPVLDMIENRLEGLESK